MKSITLDMGRTWQEKQGLCEKKEKENTISLISLKCEI